MTEAKRQLEEAQLGKYVAYLAMRQNLIRMEEIDVNDLTAEERERYFKSLNEARDDLTMADGMMDELPLTIDPEAYQEGRADGMEWASADTDESEAVRSFLRFFKLDVLHASDAYEQMMLLKPELEYHGYSYARGFVEGASEIAAAD